MRALLCLELGLLDRTPAPPPGPHTPSPRVLRTNNPYSGGVVTDNLEAALVVLREEVAVRVGLLLGPVVVRGEEEAADDPQDGALARVVDAEREARALGLAAREGRERREPMCKLSSESGVRAFRYRTTPSKKAPCNLISHRRERRRGGGDLVVQRRLRRRLENGRPGRRRRERRRAGEEERARDGLHRRRLLSLR